MTDELKKAIELAVTDEQKKAVAEKFKEEIQKLTPDELDKVAGGGFAWWGLNITRKQIEELRKNQ